MVSYTSNSFIELQSIHILYNCRLQYTYYTCTDNVTLRLTKFVHKCSILEKCSIFTVNWDLTVIKRLFISVLGILKTASQVQSRYMIKTQEINQD